MEDIGRTRTCTTTRLGHASARKEAGAGAPPKRGRRRGTRMVEGLVEGTHDAEAGGSGSGGSRSRSRRLTKEAQEAARPGGSRLRRRIRDAEPQEQEQEGAYLNDDSNSDHEQAQRGEPVESQQDQPPVVEEEEEGEGYGGGPSDMSLLYDYHKHKAIPIWNVRHHEDPLLKKRMRAIPNGKKVIDIPKPARNVDWFWDPIIESGLEPLTRTNYNILDQGLLHAFAERWHPETSTFHLPIGEVGITLDDVQCLMHLRIDGPFLDHGRCTRLEGVELVSRYLGMEESDVWKDFFELKGPHMRYGDLEYLYEENWSLAEEALEEEKPMEEVTVFRERCIRAFLLHLVCCTIFSNKSQNYVDVLYLRYFQDLTEVHQCNWGAAALTYLEHFLDSASTAGIGQIAGYMSFVQGWIISHFPRMSVWRLADNYVEMLPRCARFEPGQGHMDAAGYREHLDNLQMSDVVYTLYNDHRHVRPLVDVCWFSVWLRSGTWTAKHLPERVLRQYGHIQSIPRDPAMSAPGGLTMDQIDQIFNEEMTDRMIDGEMRGAVVQNPWDYVLGYVAWFYRVSHPLMLRPSAKKEPPRPPMLEVLFEQQGRNHVRDTVQICKDVREELQRAVRAGEVVAGTPMYDTVQRVLGMLDPAVVYASRRVAMGMPERRRNRATQ